LGRPVYVWPGRREDEIGVATGVAWTEAGGDILPIEVTLLDGKGGLLLTGQLGEVMQESIQAALSYARSRAKQFKIQKINFDKIDIHVHVPEGGIPKDAVGGHHRGDCVDLRVHTAARAARSRYDGRDHAAGRVLPIGGLKEKVMAAHRAGLKTMIVPRKNEKDMVEIPKKILSDLKFILVEHMDEVVREALRPARPVRRMNTKKTPTRKR